jgi:hypothetical protein
MSRKRFHFEFTILALVYIGEIRFSIESKFIIKFEAARALQSHYYSFSTTIIKLKRFNWNNGCRGINLAYSARGAAGCAASAGSEMRCASTNFALHKEKFIIFG